MMTPERATVAVLLAAFLIGGFLVVQDFWRIWRRADHEVDAAIDGERPITVRRKDGALVTTTLDPQDIESIERFLDTVRVPEPRASKGDDR